MKKQYLLGIIAVLLSSVFWGAPAAAESRRQSDDELVARGEYLTTIGGCVSCHTPYKAAYSDLAALTEEQLLTIALFEHDAKDETMAFAGGTVFDLGPAGYVISANITPDEATGIGTWSDEAIETALRTGMRPDGRVLHPLMPYPNFNGLADADVAAIIAFLRSLEPISNQIVQDGLAIPTGALQPLPMPAGAITAPPQSDEAAYGEYLVRHVMSCSDCHTPLDPNSGFPQMDLFLAGGQPYEGPWGIVYGGNITPDEATGLGGVEEAAIVRALTAGVTHDDRRIVLMPWQYYGEATAADAAAVAHYLANELPAVNNEVPAPSLQPAFVQMVSSDTEAEPEATSGLLAGAIIAIALFAMVAFGGMLYWRRRV